MMQASMAAEPNPRILVVEDDDEIARFLSAALKKAGMSPRVARDKTSTFEQFAQELPDLVLLDVMLPGEDGFRILRRIRERHDMPVIMLTALAETDDKVKGLTIGADDYIAKPFQTSEVIARVKAVLKRTTSPLRTEAATTYRFDGWTLDTRTRRVLDPKGVHVMLTSGEFDVLRVLCEHAGIVMSRDRLVEISQNRMVEPYDRSVDTLVSRIRKKLETNGMPTGIITTVRNEGYLFTPDVEAVSR